jgi:LacI family transcriptional regulator
MTSPKPTMAEVAKAANVGIATVDRVLNGRAKVRPDTERKVMDAANKLGFTAKAAGESAVSRGVQGSGRRTAFVLQQRNPAFYQQVKAALDTAFLRMPKAPAPHIVFCDGVAPDQVANALLELRGSYDSIGVVAADDALIGEAIAELSDSGAQVYTLMTDQAAERRAGYVGLDNRKVGRTAAWAIAHMSRRTGPVGIIMGHHRLLCQESAEIGFRSYFREHYPQFSVLDPLLSLEDPELAYAATQKLLKAQPDLAGLYLNSGAVEGVYQALRDSGRHSDLVCISHELVAATRMALTDGTIAMSLAHPLDRIAGELMLSATSRTLVGAQVQSIVPFDIFTSENI